jgi:3-methyladenine DNA glycosylase AlkD
MAKEKAATTKGRAADALAQLEALADERTRTGLARYGIVTADRTIGVPMGAIQKLAKSLGRDHDLALALWETRCYEARLLAAYVDDPARVTAAQMDRWSRDFDNWGTCDTICFVLFDKTPHAFAKVEQWSSRRDEMGKRAAFALLASLALHDKTASDEAFARCLPLIERGADDERNFVKKGVSWALRLVGRRSVDLNEASVALAKRLASSEVLSARWVGREALRELTSPAVLRRIEARKEKRPKAKPSTGSSRRRDGRRRNRRR